MLGGACFRIVPCVKMCEAKTPFLLLPEIDRFLVGPNFSMSFLLTSELGLQEGRVIARRCLCNVTPGGGCCKGRDPQFLFDRSPLSSLETNPKYEYLQTEAHPVDGKMTLIQTTVRGHDTSGVAVL